MQFDYFVLPFSLSLLYLTIYLCVKFTWWYKALPVSEKLKARKYVLTYRSLSACKEVFMEALLHRKMFIKNPLLGYMHMSFAFGWFMLIAIGNLESRIASGTHINLPFYPIFFKFFYYEKDKFPLQAGFNFIMDLFLLLVLSGILIALLKRAHSKLFSMKHTTRLKPIDRIAMLSLWFIFPLRFLAESFTSALFENGHFLTHNAGLFFSRFLPVDQLQYPAWWAYSTALGVFFIVLPHSRYMHIPTEVMLIFLRKYGIATSQLNQTFSKFEIHSCSSCGVCIDTCQLNVVFPKNPVPPSYFLRQERDRICDHTALNSCLVCGRCQEACPVGINVNGIRINSRNRGEIPVSSLFIGMDYKRTRKADVIYFAGCMTQLTPRIKLAMKNIFDNADLKYLFIDEFETICCGRPMMLAGQYEQAGEMIRKNTRIIHESGARLMVVSCPICYKVFADEYKLDITLLHHTEFISQLIREQKIKLKASHLKTVYHDPCDLARGANIYKAPREVLGSFSQLSETDFDGRQSLCCGGSLGGLKVSFEERKKISAEALDRMNVISSDLLVTSCPLCKKTFSMVSPVPVKDIAELVSESMVARKINHNAVDDKQIKNILISRLNN